MFCQHNDIPRGDMTSQISQGSTWTCIKRPLVFLAHGVYGVFVLYFECIWEMVVGQYIC
jgi:hypothetical protein